MLRLCSGNIPSSKNGMYDKMGKITIRETSQVGESRSEVEYIFEDSSDYFAWSEQKTEALNNAIKGIYSGLSPLDEELVKPEVKVKKKETIN